MITAAVGEPFVDEISERDPDLVTDSGSRTWSVRGRNFTVAITELGPGDSLTEHDVPDGRTRRRFGVAVRLVLRSGLAVRAAAAGVNVDRLALYEPPFVVAEGDDGPPKDLAQQITVLLAEGRHSDAVTYFKTRVQGMPGIAVSFMKLMPRMWSNLTKPASTLPYDVAVMGDTQQGKPLDAEEWKRVAVRTRVLTGGKSPAAFQRAALAAPSSWPRGKSPRRPPQLTGQPLKGVAEDRELGTSVAWLGC